MTSQLDSSRADDDSAARFRLQAWVTFAAGALLPTAVVALVAYALKGMSGVAAVALAAAIVVSTGLLSLTANHWLRGLAQPLVPMLLGMGLRMAVALAACLLVHQLGGPLAEAGFVYYMLVLYPISLAAETVVVVRELSAAQGQPRGKTEVWSGSP